MPTSGTTLWPQNRDQIITRALRIVGAIGEGETPTPDAVTEAAIALEAMLKEWQADGMSLWAVKQYALTPVAGQRTYLIGDGAANDTPAPLKIIQQWYRNTTTNLDTPMLLTTQTDYDKLGNKFVQSTPNQLIYYPPGNLSLGYEYGTIALYPVPNANFASNYQIHIGYMAPYENAGDSTDVLDFPSYWTNAVTWGLAGQLAFEYHVGLAERAMINKKADAHKDKALSFGTEEGSFKMQPTPQWSR